MTGGWITQYRFQTHAVAGPWRDSRLEALRDAVEANQAVIDPGAPDDVQWRVDGLIETREIHRGAGDPGITSAA